MRSSGTGPGITRNPDFGEMGVEDKSNGFSSLSAKSFAIITDFSHGGARRIRCGTLKRYQIWQKFGKK